MQPGKENMEKIDWWRDARFGMFIHWGLYSILGRGEWAMWCERIPKEEYAKLADSFLAERYNPEEWVRFAKKTGMKYMVLTTRHHDGFCLFDSKLSDFTTVKTAAKRDLTAEYVEACRKHGMKIGLYYSLLDWRYDTYRSGPAKDPSGWKEFIEYIHRQVEELMTNYGKIDLLWYDGGWPYTLEDWQSKKLNAMVRKHQPDILINDRSGTPEDFDTRAEQFIQVSGNRDWECCMPLSDFWWGYIPGDRHGKAAYEVIRNLAICAGHGGNYILNIGPKPDGTVVKRDVQVLSEVGAWLGKNGESIYGTRQGVSNEALTPLVTTFGSVTTKSGMTYLHMFYWHREFAVPGVSGKVKEAYFLKNRQKVEFSQSGDKVFIKNLPPSPLDKYNTVIVLCS